MTMCNDFLNDVEKLVKKYPDIFFIICENMDDNEFYIESIMRLHPATSKKGLGKEFLKCFGDLCDLHKINVELQIEDYSSVDKLAQVYEHAGFYIIEDVKYEYVRMRRDHE